MTCQELIQLISQKCECQRLRWQYERPNKPPYFTRCPRCIQLREHEAEILSALRESDLNREMLAAMKFTIVATIGGEDYEGNPTSEINYLQRLRILVEKESQMSSLKAESVMLKRLCHEASVALANGQVALANGGMSEVYKLVKQTCEKLRAIEGESLERET